jgi:spore coat protein CotF
MCSHHAYDIWKWMAKKGYYPLQQAPQNVLQMIGGMYNVVENPQKYM